MVYKRISRQRVQQQDASPLPSSQFYFAPDSHYVLLVVHEIYNIEYGIDIFFTSAILLFL